jgi:AcrR family transcriptional regulator
MKNIREISKENTRRLILSKTREIIVLQGIINTSTKQISDRCKIAHGTIFAHFKNREVLIGTVVKTELIRIAEKLYQLAEENNPFDKLLEEYLNLVAQEEDLLLVIHKEFAFFSDYLKNEIITTETIVKKFFYDALSKDIEAGWMKPLNVSMLISCLFGTISYYLMRKEYCVSSGSVILQKKQEIIQLFKNLIKH